jgi:hypothetical protein
VLLLQLAKKILPLWTTSPNNIKKKEAMVMDVMLMMDVVLAMVMDVVLMMDVVLAMVTKVTCTLKLNEGVSWVGV